MADRYWVGGNGSVSDTAHWAASSGGAGGESIPGSTDNVFFDSNSGTAYGTVNIDSSITVNNLFTEDQFDNRGMRFIGAGLIVRGDLTLECVSPTNCVNAILLSVRPLVNTTSNIKIVGGSFFTTSSYGFSEEGTVKLLSNLWLGNLLVQNGEFDTNGFNVLHEGYLKVNNGATLTCGTSTIKSTGNKSSEGTFNFHFEESNAINAGSATLQLVPGNVNSPSRFGTHTISRMDFLSSGIIVGCGAVFDYLYYKPGGTYSFYPCDISTPTVTTRVFDAQGVSGTPIVLTRMELTGTASICAEEYLVDYVTASYINSGCPIPYDGPVVDPHGTDGGENNNWIFSHWFEGIPGAFDAKPQMDKIQDHKPFMRNVLQSKPQLDRIITSKPALK
jgi:hypothetical protein